MYNIINFDFGNDSVTADNGYKKIERIYINSRYMWINELSNRWHSETLPSPYRDIVFGREGEFRIGLLQGEYCFELHFFDPNEDWQPFEVSFGAATKADKMFCGEVYQRAVITYKKAEKLIHKVTVNHKGGVLAISFKGISGGSFFVSGLKVFGKEGAALERMYEEAPLDILPEIDEVNKNSRNSPLEMLKNVCDWICDKRLPDGFVGDFEGGKRLWYTASYPIRTLLAGYELFEDEEYFNAAVHLLDLLVSEQMPEGSFTQAYRCKKTENCSSIELDEVRKTNWMNLADVGSMVAVLAVACKYAKGERRVTYLASVKRYLDDWALRFNTPNGGFTNGWVLRFDEKVYSVSTAASALTLGVYAKLTGDRKYLKIAENAALLLAKNWNENGKNWNFIYDNTYPGHDHYQGANEFGDGFYTAEALSALLALSDSKEVRASLFNALRRYLFGSEGLIALKKDQSWWSLQNIWHNSKSAGNPILLLDFLRYSKEFGATQEEIAIVQTEFELCQRFICDEKYAGLLGVMVNDPSTSVPFPVHSIQSWTGCAVAATGFAGIALAQLAKPGIIY